MEQVSESTAGTQEATRSLQSQSLRQNEQATQKSDEVAESNSQSQPRQTEDRVVISREAQAENRGTQNSTGGERAETNSRIKEEARENKNAEAQLRKFQDQNNNEVRIEPRKVSESVEEVQGQRERAAEAKETVFETPSQRIIQKDDSSQSQPTRSAENTVRNEETESSRQSPSPSRAETGTGQNVDDLI